MTLGQDLLNTHLLLGHLHMTDPALAIQNAVAWLCPHQVQLLGRLDGYVWDDYDDGDDAVLYALMSCQKLFPEVYEEALDMIRKGKKYDAIEGYLLNQINLNLLDGEIWDLEQMQWGVPLVGMGCDLYTEEWWEENSSLHPILEGTGISFSKSFMSNHRSWNNWHVEKIEVTKEDVARVLISSLFTVDPESVRGVSLPPTIDEVTARMSIGWFLLWLFNNTGAELADIYGPDLEEQLGYSGERLGWTPEDFAHVCQITEEAHRVIDAVRVGLDYLREPKWHNAFIRNWTKIERMLNSARKPTQKSCLWPKDTTRRARSKTKRRA